MRRERACCGSGSLAGSGRGRGRWPNGSPRGGAAYVQGQRAPARWGGAVADRLAALGAVVLDGDKAARAVVEPGTPGLARIAETFGPGVRRADGSLDRAKLAGIVFSDEVALEKLNDITHPLIHEHLQAAEDAAVKANGPDTIVVHDIPLLAEGQRSAEFAVVIVVDVPPEVQLSRLAGRGPAEEPARARVARYAHA